MAREEKLPIAILVGAPRGQAAAGRGELKLDVCWANHDPNDWFARHARFRRYNPPRCCDRADVQKDWRSGGEREIVAEGD